jgi:hypothetical protein
MTANESGPPHLLLEALNRLQERNRTFRQSIGPSYVPPIELQGWLKRICHQPRKDTPTNYRTVDFKALHQAVISAARSNNFSTLTLRDLRLIGMSPDIVGDACFADLLKARGKDINDRTLIELCDRVHQLWEHPNVTALKAFCLGRLQAYQGKNHTLLALQQHRKILLTDEGVTLLAETVAKQKLPKAVWLKGYPIRSERTPYTDAVRRQAIESFLRRIAQRDANVPSIWQYLLEELISLPGDETLLGRLIVLVHQLGAHEAKEWVKVWCLHPDHLGDPRMAQHKSKWLQVGDEAKAVFINWLSEEDLRFFFDSLIRKYDHETDRMVFFRQYLNSVCSSRVLLSELDEERLRSTLRTMQKNHKTLPGQTHHKTTSAFVLDLGRVLAIVYSELGNATYLYLKRALPKSVHEAINQLYNKNRTFLLSEFKISPAPVSVSNDFARTEPIVRIIHQGDWQTSARNWLSHHGIRPDN